MDAATISLIETIINLLVKLAPELESWGKQVWVEIQASGSPTADQLKQIQEYTDTIGAKLDADIKTRLGS